MTASPGQGAPPPGANDERRYGHIDNLAQGSADDAFEAMRRAAGDDTPIVARDGQGRVWSMSHVYGIDEEAQRVTALSRHPVDVNAAGGVRVQATEYVVSALPEDDGERGWHYGSAFDIQVSYRGRGLWAVIRHTRCLSTSGNWDHESIPSGRTDEWLAEHRFDLDTALRYAREWAPSVGVNGHTVADVRARIEEARDA